MPSKIFHLFDEANEESPVFNMGDEKAYNDLLDQLNNIIAEGEHDDILFTFFGAGADVGFEDPDHYIGVIGNPGLLLGDSAEYTQMTERGALTYNYDKEDFLYITERLGMENTKAEEIFDNAIDYEREYAKYIYTYEDQMASDYFDKINNKVTIEDIYGISEYFPVEAFMKNYDLVYDGVYLNISPEYYSHFDEFYNADHFEKIKDTMLIEVEQVLLLKWLVNILNKIGKTKNTDKNSVRKLFV